jgi:hypothetical protein
MSDAQCHCGPVRQVATGDRAILPAGAKTIPIYVMGKRYEVPETLTIMKAMEFAGFKFLRGAGCRGGICGACPTVYRHVSCATPFLPSQSGCLRHRKDRADGRNHLCALPRAFPVRGVQQLHEVLSDGSRGFGLHIGVKAGGHCKSRPRFIRLHPVRAVREPVHGRAPPVSHCSAGPAHIRKIHSAKSRAP